MTGTAETLPEDEETGPREYAYRKLADDHYYQATSHLLLACEKVPIRTGSFYGKRQQNVYHPDNSYNVFEPNYGQMERESENIFHPLNFTRSEDYCPKM